MNAFKNIGKSIVSSITTKGDDKILPDDILLNCNDKLLLLRSEITSVRNQFTQWSEQMGNSCECGVFLSKSVETFYNDSSHDGRSKSILNFCKAQDEIANDCFYFIQNEISKESGVCSELDEWLEAIKQLLSQIEDAQRANIASITTNTRLQSLKEQYNKKKEKFNPGGDNGGDNSNNNNNNKNNDANSSKNNHHSSIFSNLTSSNVTEQDLKDLSNKINETTTVEQSLRKDFEDARNKVEKQVNTIMNEKYILFDRIYVKILESQYDFYKNAHNHIARFEKAIKYYRKQFPKNETSNSNLGSLHGSRNGSKGSFGSVNINEISNASNVSNGSNENIEYNISPNSPKNRNKNSKRNSNTNISIRNVMEKTKYQSVADLLDFGMNSNKNDDNNNNSGNGSGNSNRNNNNSNDNLNKNNSQSNNNNNNGLDDLGMVSEEAPPLEKENSFDLMAGFGAEPANNNSKSSSSSSKQNKTNAKSQQNSYMNGTTTNNSINNNNNNNNNSSNNNEVNNGSNPSKMSSHTKGQVSLFSLFISDIQQDNNSGGNGGNGDSSRNVNGSSNDNSGNIDLGMGGVNEEKQSIESLFTQGLSGSMAGSTLSGSGGGGGGITVLSEKEKARVNRVAQERYEEIQRRFDEEDAEREERQNAFDKHGSRIDLWEYDTKGTRRNLRTLLTTLQRVLWQDSGWKPITLANLVNHSECKKQYRKAVRLVHPDRSAHRGDTTERKAICERIFEALNAAWQEFGNQST